MRSLLFVLLCACGGGSPAVTPTTPSTPPAGDPSCPVEVTGTSVTVEDTETGAALVFVTTGDVAELRKRTGGLAQKHNDHHAAMGPLPDGTASTAGAGGHEHHDHANHAQPGGHDHAAGGTMIQIHSKAVASDVEGGVKLAFISNASDIGKLQAELRMHAKHYASGTCGMK